MQRVVECSPHRQSEATGIFLKAIPLGRESFWRMPVSSLNCDSNERFLMSKYTKTDAAKDTGSSTKEVAAAHHEARTDSGARSGKDAAQFKSAPSWAEKTTSSGTPLFPKGK